MNCLLACFYKTSVYTERWRQEDQNPPWLHSQCEASLSTRVPASKKQNKGWGVAQRVTRLPLKHEEQCLDPCHQCESQAQPVSVCL